MNKNDIELLGTYGSDESHALSAWTSTSRDLPDTKRERIPKLLAMLATEGHHTPFEKSSIHFLLTAEMASHIHLLKHRVGVSVNGESARYKELKDDKFYIPEDAPINTQREMIKNFKGQLEQYHKTLTELVDGGMDKKRAKDIARFYLPYGNQLKFDVMFNFRSFAHFQGLRNDAHAQKEIRDIAKRMLELVKETGDFNDTIEAFGLNDPKFL